MFIVTEYADLRKSTEPAESRSHLKGLYFTLHLKKFRASNSGIGNHNVSLSMILKKKHVY